MAPEVAARYLQEQANGRYRFRKAYSTEAALAAVPARRCLGVELAPAVRGGAPPLCCWVGCAAGCA